MSCSIKSVDLITILAKCKVLEIIIVVWVQFCFGAFFFTKLLPYFSYFEWCPLSCIVLIFSAPVLGVGVLNLQEMFDLFAIIEDDTKFSIWT